jgi:hypothetical protein
MMLITDLTFLDSLFNSMISPVVGPARIATRSVAGG